MGALFQACLAKRPFNLFHRANLSLRTTSVERTFGNKTTWERPFEELVLRFVNEYNAAVFCNGQKNKVIGGYDALNSPNGVDLVYMDPPYVGKAWSEGTNYANLYHFLEGIADYDNWESNIDYCTKTRRFTSKNHSSRFVRKTEVMFAFFELLERFQDNILVISYRANGYPDVEEIRDKLILLGKRVSVAERPHKYVLSRRDDAELLIVAN
jgi:adenine-specific DNA methylase